MLIWEVLRAAQVVGQDAHVVVERIDQPRQVAERVVAIIVRGCRPRR